MPEIDFQPIGSGENVNRISIEGWEPTRGDYRQLFQKVPCYISVQTPELRIIQTNDLFRQDFGDRVGELCYEVYKRKAAPCPECPVAKTFEDGQVHVSEEQVITRDGNEAFVIVYTSPLRNKRGEIVAVMEMSTNITSVKRLQTELTMMGHTVATMAHGIKNILTGLDGGIYVVNSGLNKKDQAEDLHTILSNLVHNALDACKFDLNRKDHRVVVKTHLKGPIAIFEVSDNDPGLPQGWENYVFTEVLSTKERYGTGLGLLVTKKIVDELGGQITVSSHPDEGTTFRVSFPMKPVVHCSPLSSRQMLV